MEIKYKIPTLKSTYQQTSIRSVNFILLFILAFGGSHNAQALTINLDFTSTATDIFGQVTGDADYTGFGFSGGLTDTAIEQSLLSKIQDHFLGYPTASTNVFSALPAGKELDIDFVIGTAGSAPSNGDPESYAIKIGTGISGSAALTPNIFGSACLSCARDELGIPNPFSLVNGSLIGSIWTDHIDSIASLALDNDGLFNLIAGTISHEIGHTLSLDHPDAQAANPGASAWGVMGSWATTRMPNDQRVLEREFTYANFTQLIGAVGLRDTVIVNVPEPNILVIFVMGLGGLLLIGRKQVA